MLAISARIWNSLTAEEQRILQEAVDESVAFNRVKWIESEQESLDKVQAAGVTIIRPDKNFSGRCPAYVGKYNGTELGDLIRKIQEVQ